MHFPGIHCINLKYVFTHMNKEVAEEVNIFNFEMRKYNQVLLNIKICKGNIECCLIVINIDMLNEIFHNNDKTLATIKL